MSRHTSRSYDWPLKTPAQPPVCGQSMTFKTIAALRLWRAASPLRVADGSPVRRSGRRSGGFHYGGLVAQDQWLSCPLESGGQKTLAPSLVPPCRPQVIAVCILGDFYTIAKVGAHESRMRTASAKSAGRRPGAGNSSRRRANARRRRGALVTRAPPWHPKKSKEVVY